MTPPVVSECASATNIDNFQRCARRDELLREFSDVINTDKISDGRSIEAGERLWQSKLPRNYLGETMVFFGILGTIIVWIGTVSRDHGRGGSRR